MKRLFVFSLLATVSAVALFSATQFFIKEKLLERIKAEYGFFAKNRAVALVKTMSRVQNKDERAKLKAINDFFNKTPYGFDKDVWGVSDYWATRFEFIGVDKGDCEDYVIAKYFTLLELGIPAKKLFFTYAKYKPTNIAHMVLTYYETPRAEPLILDNYNYKILLASKRDDIIPIYSFSGEDLLGAKEARLGRLLPASTRQDRPWDELKILKKELP